MVVDCTPKGVGARNKERYEAAGVKAVFQGGEEHELAGFSFVAQVNYAGALDRRWARVVSCNTTALCRVLHALDRNGWVKRARAVLLRRATDPWESHHTGMINTAIPETRVPRHQGPDAQTVSETDTRLGEVLAHAPRTPTDGRSAGSFSEPRRSMTSVADRVHVCGHVL